MRITAPVLLLAGFAGYALPLIAVEAAEEPTISVSAGQAVSVDCHTTTKTSRVKAVSSVGIPTGLFDNNITGSITCLNQEGKILWRTLYLCHGTSFNADLHAPTGSATLTCLK